MRRSRLLQWCAPGLGAALLWLAIGATGATGAFAQSIAPRLAQCAACHGADGNSQIKDFPSLAGQPRVFLENQLVMIREGMRDIPAMKGSLDGVSDADITALAKHYASLPVKSAPGAHNSAWLERGRQLAGDMRCGICHLPSYQGREQMPRLAGQREDYLLHSMRQFRSNQAVGRDTLMAAALYGVSDQDLQAMAHFLARTPP
jgi:cytochrome c553